MDEDLTSGIPLREGGGGDGLTVQMKQDCPQVCLIDAGHESMKVHCRIYVPGTHWAGLLSLKAGPHHHTLIGNVTEPREPDTWIQVGRVFHPNELTCPISFTLLLTVDSLNLVIWASSFGLWILLFCDFCNSPPGRELEGYLCIRVISQYAGTRALLSTSSWGAGTWKRSLFWLLCWERTTGARCSCMGKWIGKSNACKEFARLGLVF